MSSRQNGRRRKKSINIVNKWSSAKVWWKQQPSRMTIINAPANVTISITFIIFIEETTFVRFASSWTHAFLWYSVLHVRRFSTFILVSLWYPFEIRCYAVMSLVRFKNFHGLNRFKFKSRFPFFRLIRERERENDRTTFSCGVSSIYFHFGFVYKTSMKINIEYKFNVQSLFFVV